MEFCSLNRRWLSIDLAKISWKKDTWISSKRSVTQKQLENTASCKEYYYIISIQLVRLNVNKFDYILCRNV